MDHGLHRGYPSHPSVEVVIGPKVPASEPHDDVIPHPKQPYKREVGKRYNTSPVGYEPQNLISDRRVARWKVSQQIHTLQVVDTTDYMFPGNTRYPCIVVITFRTTKNPNVRDCALGGTVPQRPKLSAHRRPKVAGVSKRLLIQGHREIPLTADEEAIGVLRLSLSPAVCKERATLCTTPIEATTAQNMSMDQLT